MPGVRVVIADHQLVAEGLRRILEPEFSVVGVFTTAAETLGGTATLQPEILLVEPSLPGFSATDLDVRFQAQTPRIKLILLTHQGDAAALGRSVRVGAAGFVLKQQTPAELRDAVRTVAAGRHYIAPAMQDHLPWARALRPVRRDGPESRLTVRQWAVLQLLAAGSTSKEIGERLSISPKTVEFHKAGITEQLGLRGTAALTRFAVEHGVLTD